MRVSPAVLRVFLGLMVIVSAACGGDVINQPPPPVTNCTTVAPTVLAIGASTIIDPTPSNLNGCLLFPAAGPAGAEHLVVAVSSAGQVTTNGNFGTYSFTGSPAPAPSLASRLLLTAFAPPIGAQQFHRMLRDREKAIADDPATHLFRPTSATRSIPPNVGDQRSFQVCAQAQCTGFVTVTATAKHVGPRGAIYLDNNWLTSYTQQDIDTVGTLFDSFMYPIDTTAFGRESDLDNNGVVVVLLTHAVNDLSTNCVQNGVILGYFFGNDLTNNANSNLGEVFYGLVPDPGNANCPISSAYAKRNIAPTFIHEFQHMISFNRHVLLPPVPSSSEETWLNEGMSHYAEELGGAQIPDAECQPPSCANQFVSGDFANGAGYLQAPENTFVISPDTSFGTLDERGSEWLYVRWLAEHFASDTILGTSFTRAIDGADNPNGLTLLGDANVTAVTGNPFTTLIPQWQMANYLESLGGFSEPTGRLRYRVLGTGGQLDPRIYYSTHGGYPLQPDSTLTGNYNRQGILRAGSGVHLLVIQPASGTAVTLQLTTTNTAAVVPRFGVIRIR